jgi:uncharacterized membrane protein
MKRRTELSTPRERGLIGIHYDHEAFGNFSEAIARFIGTARFLVWQTVIVIIWIGLNIASAALRWDKYPFILLNLAFSTQAAYAAPLILLAQNRQETRDRSQVEMDREINARTKADTEFLAREIASVRLALSDVVTTEDLRDQLAALTNDLHRLLDRLEATDESGPGSATTRADG